MEQYTAKSAMAGWHWIHTKAHHTGECEFNKDSEVTHTVYVGRHTTLRVPIHAPWAAEFFNGIRVNPRPFDTRRWALKVNIRTRVEKEYRLNREEYP